MANNFGRATKGVTGEGPRDHKSRLAQRTGEILKIASKEVISTHPSTTIKKTAGLMRDNDVRRLPVIHPGTKKLEGMITAIDIIDFLGGGEKYRIIERDFNGNFLSAVNSAIAKIMRPSQYLEQKASVEEVVDIMLDKKTSCIPVVAGRKDMQVVALVTERDILPKDDPDGLGVTVGEIMKKELITASLGMMLSDVSKIMVRNQIRRLPVIREDRLVGVVTSLDVLGYLEKGDFKGVGAEENLSTRVEEIMAENVVFLAPQEDLGEVVKLVRETGYGGFPVVEDDKVQGIITTTDVLRWVYRQ